MRFKEIFDIKPECGGIPSKRGLINEHFFAAEFAHRRIGPARNFAAPESLCVCGHIGRFRPQRDFSPATSSIEAAAYTQLKQLSGGPPALQNLFQTWSHRYLKGTLSCFTVTFEMNG
jgi:hypothetical protein